MTGSTSSVLASTALGSVGAAASVGAVVVACATSSVVATTGFSVATSVTFSAALVVNSTTLSVAFSVGASVTCSTPSVTGGEVAIIFGFLPRARVRFDQLQAEKEDKYMNL